MKLKLLSLVPVLALALAGSPALAQGVNTRADFRGETRPIPVRVNAEAEARVEMEQRKASSTERRAEAKQNMEARRASSTEARVDMQLNIIKRLAAHTARVFTATVERLEKIITRIESRMDKMESQGADIASAEASIAVAEDHLAKAKVSIAAFVSADFSGESLRENMEELRGMASEVKAHLRATHTALKDAVSSLKVSAEAEVKAEVESDN